MLTIPFTLTRAEVSSVYRRLWLRGRSNWTLIAIGASFAAYGAAVAEPAFIVFGVAYVLFWLAFLLLVAPWIAWRRFQQSGPGRVVTVSEHGIALNLPHTNSTTDWTVWKHADLLADVYVIRARHRGYCLIPRRAFSSAQEEESFRALVADGIGTAFR